MSTYHQECLLPYTADALFSLVADVEKYPEFVPWCKQLRVIERAEDTLLAEVTVAYALYHKTFVCRVFLERPNREIYVELVEGPLHHLYNSWKFTDTADGTLIEADVDFALRSRILDAMMSLVFDEACDKVITAFKMRAAALFGNDHTE